MRDRNLRPNLLDALKQALSDLENLQMLDPQHINASDTRRELEEQIAALERHIEVVNGEKDQAFADSD